MCVFISAYLCFFHNETKRDPLRAISQKNMLEEFLNWRGWGGVVLTGKRPYPVYLLHSGGKLAHPFFSHRLSSSSHLSSWAASRWGKKNWKCCRYKIFIEFILIPILVNSLRKVKLIENWIESFYSHCFNSHVTHHVYVD